MKLLPWQVSWINSYEEARKKGGIYNSADSEWVEFENIPVPDWYTQYISLVEEAVPQEATRTEIVQSSVQKVVTSLNEAAKELGRKGGLKTKERGTEYYREIGRMGGRGNRK